MKTTKTKTKIGLIYMPQKRDACPDFDFRQLVAAGGRFMNDLQIESEKNNPTRRNTL